MLFYIVTYDISSDKRRKRVSDVLEGYGRRVQFSVFECILSTRKFSELSLRLQKCIKIGEDSVRFYPLSRHTLGQIVIWGEPPLTELPRSTVI
jgi:CRISPR-associated protein Cas2